MQIWEVKGQDQGRGLREFQSETVQHSYDNRGRLFRSAQTANVELDRHYLACIDKVPAVHGLYNLVVMHRIINHRPIQEA